MSNKEPRTVDPTRELLTVKDVAVKLTISVTTVWRLIRKGDLPAPIHIGGQARWKRKDIDAFIDGLGGVE